MDKHNLWISIPGGSQNSIKTDVLYRKLQPSAGK